jgi:hypothetical protein
MKWLLGSHPFSTLVTLAVVALTVKLIFDFFNRKNKTRNESVDGGMWAAFISGVLFTNALPHFIHGISGEQFAAPFGYLLGTGYYEYLSNVLWGFLNIVLGYSWFIKGKVSGSDARRKISFFSGILLMGIALSYIFSH